jgi:hypothetical protein
MTIIFRSRLKGKRSNEGVCNEGTGGCGQCSCEAESQSHGTATLIRCILSAVVKSLSKKCLLHRYLLCSILTESLMLDNPNFLPLTKALQK